VASQPHVPTRGERNTQKIFGAVRLDTAQFIYLHQQDYFQWETYVAFLDQVLEGLQAMNTRNWPAVCRELMKAIQEERPG